MALFATACATQAVDPNYMLQLQHVADVQRAYAAAEQARYTALAELARTGDTTSRTAAVLALALAGGSNARPDFKLPVPPENDADRAYKWAALLVGPLSNVGFGYFGYRLGVTQSNNNAATTIAGYNTFGTIANSGFNANASIAGAGFGSLGTLAAQLQPSNTYNLGRDGVIGAGSFNAPTTTTRTCTGGSGQGGSTTDGGAAGPAGAGGSANC